MATDKISIIIPVFNSGTILSLAIESILSQDYKNLELIIIDGGSKDKTIELLKKYNSQINYWISESDNGIYDAMNKGIEAATGTWLLFLGADDELCYGAISAIFNSTLFTNTDMIYGKVIIRNEGKELGGQTDYEKLIEQNIPHQAIFYHKSIFQRFPGYNLRYKILADYDLNLKIFDNSHLQKKFINIIVSSFCNDGISNRTIDYSFFTEKREYFINHCKLSPKDKRLAKYYFFTGVALVLKKNFSKGASHICHGIIFSAKPFYYFLLAIDFVFSIIGLRKKYKYV